MRISAGLYKRKKRQHKAYDILFLAGMMCLVLLGIYMENRMQMETMATADASRKKIAITFDDEVIIGLSQKMSNGEVIM